MKRTSFFRGFILLLACGAVLLTSCSEVPILSSLTGSSRSASSSFNQGNGPPDHAPAWGYRRKQGQSVVAGAESVVASAEGGAKKDDGDDDHTTELLIGGAAVAAGTVYAVVNERDKAQTQAELDEIRQEMNVVTVNVTNSNGSITQVRLERQGVGYVGPKGEYYDHLPTLEELKPAYAL